MDRILAVVCGVTVALGVVGCSGGVPENPDWPKRVPASGTVLFQGKPIEGAEVTFINSAANSSGTGKTDGSGRFTLTTFTQNDGVVPGPQVVTIRRVDVIDKTPANVDVSAGGEALPPEIHWLIPEKYSIAAESGLTADVAENGPNDFKFDLK